MAVQRILFVTNNYTPYSGGVVSSIRAMHKALTDAGCDVQIVTLDFGTNEQDPPYVKRVPCLWAFTHKGNRMAIPWRPARFVREVIADYRPDIVHVHHPFLLGKYAARAARELGIPVVFTHHTMYEAYAHYVPLIPNIFLRALSRFVVRYFCARVDGVIVPSSTIAAHLHKQGIATPVCVLSSPLQESFLRVTPFGDTHKSFELLVVSRLTKEKNVYAALDIMRQLDQKAFRLTIIGYGHERKALEQYAYRTCKLSAERVQFLPKHSAQELVERYQQADLFLFCSHTDTQGLVIAEAMACGLPVVALDGPGQRDCIVQGVNGYIAQSVGEAVGLIRTLAASPSSHAELKKQARTCAEHYYPERIATQLLAWYEQCIYRKLNRECE